MSSSKSSSKHSHKSPSRKKSSTKHKHSSRIPSFPLSTKNSLKITLSSSLKLTCDELPFAKPLPTELTCPIHNGVLQDPVINKCGHSFCRTCIYTEHDQDLHQDCPICTELIEEPLFPNILATGVISRLKLSCIQCGANITVGELAHHKTICGSNPSPAASPRRYLEDAILPRIPKKKTAISWEIDFKDITLLNKIGCGAFGEVFKATFRSSTIVAVKRIIGSGNEAEKLKVFTHELKFLRSARHPNVVLFIGACLQKSNLCIVTEFMKNGCLRDEIDAQLEMRAPYDWRLITGWCIDCSAALAYLHGQDIIHRDIKSNNLLLDGTILKVADLGLARFNSSKPCSNNGNWAWAAPEMFKHETYGVEVDVYSFGVVLAEILTRMNPTDDDFPRLKNFCVDCRTLEEMIPRGANPPAGFLELMERCLQEDPRERPTAAEIAMTLNKIRDSLVSEDKNQ